MSALDDLLKRPEWHARAACRGMGTDLFFSTRGDTAKIRAAQAICARCPVRDQCAEYGMSEHVGVWGGLPERQRRRLRSAVNGGRRGVPPGTTLPREYEAALRRVRGVVHGGEAAGQLLLRRLSRVRRQEAAAAMTRRRLVNDLRTELTEARREQLRILALLAAAETRVAELTAERDGLAVRAARAEARALNTHAMCPDRATCTSNTDAAAKWRHAHPAFGGGIGPMS